MAARKPAKETAPADDFDDLLASEDAAPEAPAPEEEDVEVASAPATLTPAQKRLAEARAKAAELAKAPEPVVVTEEIPADDEYAGLSDEEIEELKALSDSNAKIVAQRIENAPVQYDNSQRGATGETILIHVLEDGFTAFGDVWLRGQEIEIGVGTPAYERTKDALGFTWLDLRTDKAGQYARWGREYIGEGPFIARPGEKFDDEVARADQRRNRSVPVLTV